MSVPFPQTFQTKDSISLIHLKEIKLLHGLFGVLIILVCLNALAGTVADPDLWGYLAFGRVFWETGRFPYHDLFAYVPTLDVWVYHEWLTGVLFYPVYRALGAAGLQSQTGEEHGDQRRQRQKQEGVGQNAIDTVRDMAADYQRHDPDQREEGLLFQEVKTAAVFLEGQGRAGAVDHDDPDADQKKNGKEQLNVIGLSRRTGCGCIGHDNPFTNCRNCSPRSA